mgnify:CR=1 FL=1
MIDDSTLGIGGTGTHTRISAMLLDAGQVGRTFCIVDTLRATAGGVGITNIGFNTLTAGGTIPFRADGIFGTRMRIAGIHLILGNWGENNS